MNKEEFLSILDLQHLRHLTIIAVRQELKAHLSVPNRWSIYDSGLIFCTLKGIILHLQHYFIPFVV